MTLELPVFRPEEAIRFFPFRKKMESFPQLVRRYYARRKKVGKKQALYDAWKAHNKNGEDDILPSYGARKFWDLMVSMLEYGRDYLEEIKKDSLRVLIDRLEANRQPENSVDPVKLIEIWSEYLDREDELGVQMRFEASRHFIIASQFAMIAIADPVKNVSRDVVAIDEETYRSVFVADSARIYAVYAVDRRKKGRVTVEPVVTDSEEQAEEHYRALKGTVTKYQKAIKRILRCRVLIEEEKTFFVLVSDRPKGPNRRLMKYERETLRLLHGVDDPVLVKDARGSTFTLVGTKVGRVVSRVGRSDVGHLRAIVIKRMWSTATMRVDPSLDDDRPKSDRHDDYWDDKFFGRYRYTSLEDDEETDCEVIVEQRFTTLHDYLNASHATDRLSHDIRRGYQTLPLLELYWPVALYGVDWDSEEVKKLLDRLWHLQLRLKQEEFVTTYKLAA
jgi:hypothetical protein